MIGKTLAHYEITSLLGKGGMGEVYRAKDQKLGRDVAIKVLPEEFAKDADRVARFQREAKVLASLNHPNIAAIHGLEKSGGTDFIVLELVEGETLADRLKRGPIPVEESLKLALQIAEALEAAHEKGVIHRDLKPANIKVTPDGKVKVLDFGLAKAFAGELENVTMSNSPTLSVAATQQGIILGTAAYMSPEQASGKAVDKRADVWAFGIVLYEMLTGRSLFAGENVSQTLARVLERQPDFSALPANLHPKIIEILQRCLVKEAGNRCHDVADARIEVQAVLADPNGVFAQPVASVGPRMNLRRMLWWVAAVFILGLIIAGVAVWNLKPPEPRQVVRFEYQLPEGQEFSNLNNFLVVAVSPDGSQFVYSTPKGLYLRSVNELTAKLITGTEESVGNPFFSPDGKWIGYYSVNDRLLKKIPINGGAPVTLCGAASLVGASWNADNTIVYGQMSSDIMRISANGGTPESFVKMGTEPPGAPQMLPDGKSVLYTRGALAVQRKIVVQSLESGKSKELFTGSMARYLPTGHIVYRLRDNLYAVPFDPGKLEVTGGPVPVIQGGTYFDVSDSGTLAYISRAAWAETAPQQLTLVWVDRKGKEEPLGAAANDYSFPKISPDGTKVALSVRAGRNGDIWIWDLIRKTMTRLTFDEATDFVPLWTPDGKRIAFLLYGGEKPGTYWKAADGTGTAELLVSSAGGGFPPGVRSWSADGKTAAFMQLSGGGNSDIGLISMEGDRASKLLLHEKCTDVDPQISPDGRWMAYSSDESGRYEIYVRPYPEVNAGKWQVSTSGGDWPLWSRDGRELFYRNGDAFMAVSVNTKPTLSLETPKMMFRGTYASPASIPMVSNWDVSPDGRRFLLLKPPESAGKAPEPEAPRKIIIVTNWFEELKQRVPVKR